MCLYYNEQYTRLVRRRLQRRQYVWCWKVLRYMPDLGDGVLTSPFVTTRTWRPGVVKSSRRKTSRTKSERATGAIDTGIHVYYDKTEAERCAARLSMICYPSYCVVRVKCLPKHFIAAGVDGEAVFFQVELPKSQHDKAIQSNR